MFVLERIHGENTRTVFVSPDRTELVQLLIDIFRDRARHTLDQPASEHLRTAAHRLSVGASDDGLLTLAGELFRIRFDETQGAASSGGRRARARLIKSLRSSTDKTWAPTTAALAVERVTRTDNDVVEDEFIDEGIISGEEFELGSDRW